MSRLKPFVRAAAFVVVFGAPAVARAEAPTVKAVTMPFRGVMFVPNDGAPHPGVLVLHGSEGGFTSGTKIEAYGLAAQGYAALALCYGGCRTGDEADSYRPNRETLDVDLETTYSALAWLARSGHVGSKKVGVYGVSRGAEQALLLASLIAGDVTRRQPDAVAVHAPSDVVVGGWNWYWRDPTCIGADGEWQPLCGRAPAVDDAHWPVAWLWSSDAASVSLGNRILVERIEAPVFITHGDQDRTWSVDRTRRIKQTMEDGGRHPEVHIFAGQGHGFTLDANYQRLELMLGFLRRTLQ